MEEITILYLDRLPANGRLVGERLAAAGPWRVVTVLSVAEMEAKLATSPYQLLLADYATAGSLGLGLVDLVQFRRPDLPLVLIFELEQEELVDQARQRGAAGYVLRTAAYLRHLPWAIRMILQNCRREEAREQALEQMEFAQQRLHTLSQRLLEAQETERRSLARELHDQIGQALTAVKINLQATQRKTDPATSTRLAESVTIVERALQTVRNMSLELRPSLLDDLGLVSALRWYVDRQAQRAGFGAHFSGAVSTPLAPHLETICFRVAQEALTNVVRHARAKEVTVTVRQEGPEVELVIADDGCGFDVAAAYEVTPEGASLGLIGMQERATLGNGRLQINSIRGQGTTVRLILPLEQEPMAPAPSSEGQSPP
jgi:signal transduction histidine kinase